MINVPVLLICATAKCKLIYLSKQNTFYPGTKKRGRPKKSEQEKREAVNAKLSSPAPDHTSRAAQGLLELSNTGKVWVPDFQYTSQSRRSGRQ